MSNDLDRETEDLDEIEFEPEPDEARPLRLSGPDPRLEIARTILKQMHETLGNVIALLDGGDAQKASRELANLVTSKQMERRLEDVSGVRMIEGVFDGQSMVGSDGNSYAVPPNYASKSRLVEGDMLKLTIRPDGSFVFKQIGPIERRRVIGRLAYDGSTASHVVLSDEGVFKVLEASVTFFKGAPGDESVVLVPKSTPSVWAAIENIVKK